MSTNSSILLSEGTCYFGPGQVADKGFIPCGNANEDGPLACCWKGDYCLSSNTCWDKDTVVTYIAGCTDPKFLASTCPQRTNYPDQQWVALARCNGNSEDLWSGCLHHPDIIEIEKENCNCNQSNVLVQNPNGSGSFDEIGLLPNATGQPLDWNPTAVPSAIPTKHQHGLSTGAKAGIGVGVAIAGLLLIAGAVFFYLRRRRNQTQNVAEKSELDGYGMPYNEKSELGNGPYRGASVHTSGQKSELSPDREILEMENSNEYNGAANRGTGFQELEGETPHSGGGEHPFR